MSAAHGESLVSEESERFNRRNYIAMLVSWVILAPTWTITAPYYQHYILALHGNEYIVGLIGALSGYTLAIVRLIGGYLTDTVGRKKIIVIFTFVLSLTYLIFYIAWSWEIVLLASILSSLALIYQPALNAIIADSVPSKYRGKGFGLIQLSTGLTGLAAIYVAIYLVSNFGIIQGVRYGYLIAFILILIAFFVRLVFLSETIKPRKISSHEFVSDFIKQYHSALQWIKENLLSLMIVVMILNLIMGIVYLTPLYITYYLNFGTEIWGYYSLLASGTQLVLALPVGHLVDKVGRKKMMVSGLMMLTVSYTILATLGLSIELLQNKLLVLMSASVLAGSAGSMWSISIQSLVADLTVPYVRGKTSAIHGFIGNISSSTGQLLSGYIYQNIGAPYTYIIPAILLLFAAPLTWLMVREKLNKKYVLSLFQKGN